MNQFLIATTLFLSSWAAADDNIDAPDIQLASVYQKSPQLSNYLVSEKLDGVRGYWDGQGMYSRSGRRIQLPRWFYLGFPSYPLDGELWMGRGRFDEVSGITRRLHHHDERWREVKFMVFDLPKHGGRFEARYRFAVEHLTGISPYLDVVEQRNISDAAALNQYLKDVIELGGEGLMLHDHSAFYRSGRAAALMKLKPYMDAEAQVVGYKPGKGKYQGMMGALMVLTPQGVSFSIGSGFTDEQRRHPPQIGDIITFKYHGLTRHQVPRFASFLRIREQQ